MSQWENDLQIVSHSGFSTAMFVYRRVSLFSCGKSKIGARVRSNRPIFPKIPGRPFTDPDLDPDS